MTDRTPTGPCAFRSLQNWSSGVALKSKRATRTPTNFPTQSLSCASRGPESRHEFLQTGCRRAVLTPVPAFDQIGRGRRARVIPNHPESSGVHAPCDELLNDVDQLRDISLWLPPRFSSLVRARPVLFWRLVWLGKASAFAGFQRDAAYLVRPDGYVALAAAAPEFPAKLKAFAEKHHLRFSVSSNG
jgi:hypothetical protein